MISLNKNLIILHPFKNKSESFENFNFVLTNDIKKNLPKHRFLNFLNKNSQYKMKLKNNFIKKNTLLNEKFYDFSNKNKTHKNLFFDKKKKYKLINQSQNHSNNNNENIKKNYIIKKNDFNEDSFRYKYNNTTSNFLFKNYNSNHNKIKIKFNNINDSNNNNFIFHTNNNTFSNLNKNSINFLSKREYSLLNNPDSFLYQMFYKTKYYNKHSSNFNEKERLKENFYDVKPIEKKTLKQIRLLKKDLKINDSENLLGKFFYNNHF